MMRLRRVMAAVLLCALSCLWVVQPVMASTKPVDPPAVQADPGAKRGDAEISPNGTLQDWMWRAVLLFVWMMRDVRLIPQLLNALMRQLASQAAAALFERIWTPFVQECLALAYSESPVTSAVVRDTMYRLFMRYTTDTAVASSGSIGIREALASLFWSHVYRR